MTNCIKKNESIPAVSVAVITYNMERYLRQLLDSILMQEVDFEYEVVIDDDCSPDGSREIILEYQRQYPHIIKPSFRNENVGGSKNMFGVLQHCKAKYIAILEGDDWWEDPKKLQYQYDFMEAHPEYVGMCCNSWCDHGDAPEYSQLMRNRTEPKVFGFEDFKARHFHDRLPSSTDTWFFRNFFCDGGDYSLIYKAHSMVWDQSLALILYCLGEFYADSQPMSHHRSVVKEGGSNYQSLYAQKNMLYEDSCMYKAMEEYIVRQGREVGDFRLVRGDVWIDAKFRAMLSKEASDREIAQRIWNDQADKGMLRRLFIAKSWDIFKRKARRDRRD